MSYFQAIERARNWSYADRVSATDRAHPCQYGHLDCSTRDGGACVDEVMSAAEEAEQMRNERPSRKKP
jgi:hypothetical protein